MKYQVAVIGCGSIGALKADEFDRPGGGRVLTHAHAIVNNQEMELKALIDPDDSKLSEAGTKWKPKQVHASLDNVLEQEELFGGFDIIVVASPTETHHETLKKISQLKSKPKVVIIEKPFCSNSKEAAEITNLYKEVQLPLLVNYTRRTVIEYEALIKTVADLKTYHALFFYGHGLWRDGCHAIEILHRLFGDIKNIITLPDTKLDDASEGDVTISSLLSFEKCPSVLLAGVDSKKFGIFELRLMTDQGQIFTSSFGELILFQMIQDGCTYGSYPVLGSTVKARQSTLHAALPFLYTSVEMMLRGEQPVMAPCTAEEALRVHKTMELIYRR